MGLTYAQSFVRSHITSKQNMMILVRSEDKAAALSAKDIGSVFFRPEDCIQSADLIILAVKPQDSAVLFESIRSLISPNQVILSIMAGVRIASIEKALQATKVIRAMPNLPAQIGAGMTAFTATDEVTRLELVMIQNLLNTTGKTIYVSGEQMIDAATAISGSGPAYVYYFMDAMMQGAQQMGFSQSEAELLVQQTFSGALSLFSNADLNCEEWIKKVASKGGTTEAALYSFKANTLHQDIIDGTFAALHRATELGN